MDIVPLPRYKPRWCGGGGGGGGIGDGDGNGNGDGDGDSRWCVVLLG